MRLWTIHPRYLDAKGLVALWREGLLAKKVLEDKTKGYRNHPQLIRFKSSEDPLQYIKSYLHLVCDVADERGYSFDRSKLGSRLQERKMIDVTSGQVKFEWMHLQKKLKLRAPDAYRKNKAVKNPRVHPLFSRRKGGIEGWEVV